MTTAGDRIKDVLEASGLSVYAFSKMVGIHHKTIKSYIGGVTEPKLTSLINIIKAFPDLNPSWLKTGKGDMWIREVAPIRMVPVSLQAPKKPKVNVETIERGQDVEASAIDAEAFGSADKSLLGVLCPYYNKDFSCGFLDMYDDEGNTPQMYVSSPVNSGNIIWCNATGESMIPTIRPGDMVAIEPITEISQLVYGEIYAIALRDQRCIKRVYQGSSKETWKLVSDNKNGLYESQEIQIQDVRRVFHVVATTHKFA